MGLRASARSASSWSSPAMRLVRSVPHPAQRWTIDHSPSFRTSMAMGSIGSRHGQRRSPGSSSRWRDQRQCGQWLRWRVPQALWLTWKEQTIQVNPESGRDLCDMGGLLIRRDRRRRVWKTRARKRVDVEDRASAQRDRSTDEAECVKNAHWRAECARSRRSHCCQRHSGRGSGLRWSDGPGWIRQWQTSTTPKRPILLRGWHLKGYPIRGGSDRIPDARLITMGKRSYSQFQGPRAPGRPQDLP